MLELQQEFRPYFYVASALLGAEFVFLGAAVSSSQSSGILTAAIVMLAASIPCALFACAACLTGDIEAAKTMLYGAGGTAAAWLALSFMHFSALAGVVFVASLAFAYRWLYMRHRAAERSKSTEGE